MLSTPLLNEIRDRIYKTALSDGMPDMLSREIVAQSAHETANYTSNAFEQDNNLFGYKYVKGARFQTGPGIQSSEHDNYAKYASLEDSVHEITGWIKRRVAKGQFPADLRTITTPKAYATALKSCGYFGDPIENYIAGLTRFAYTPEKIV